MVKLNYENLGVKIGLELHQRLNTKKLFCRCPSEIDESAKPHRELFRKQHVVLSELGEADATAQFEALRNRFFIYQLFEKNTCEVEADESPPLPLNLEALKAALEISLLLKSEIVDEVQVMRKQVLDGSAVSGFQRTSIIALNGKIETEKGEVGIPTICLEEESSGIVKQDENEAIYRLDRLGIPLIELATTPNIRDGAHANEVAEKIGALMRMTGKVQRGIGTIRQDLNVSTKRGARVEIKGAQDLSMIPNWVDNEVARQVKVLEISDELKKRFGGEIKFEEKIEDVSEIFKGTNSKLIKKAIERNESMLALALPNHAGTLGEEISPERRYGSELSDYAKGAGVNGIIHSDEDMGKYKISNEEYEAVRKKLSLNENDAFALVAAERNRALAALQNVRFRALFEGIPEETRKTLPNASTSYMRPLPGRARMYPESDIKPVRVTKEFLSEIKETISETPEEKREKLAKLVKPDLVGKLLRSKHLSLFEEIMKNHPELDATTVATTIEDTLTALKREGFELKQVENAMKKLFEEYSKGLFAKSAISEILKEMSKGKSVKKAVDDLGAKKISGEELEKIITQENSDIKQIMSKYRLQIDAKEVMELIKKKN